MQYNSAAQNMILDSKTFHSEDVAVARLSLQETAQEYGRRLMKFDGTRRLHKALATDASCFDLNFMHWRNSLLISSNEKFKGTIVSYWTLVSTISGWRVDSS